jgi:diguanylate cyclase (GGDEF)-like protein
MIESGCGDKGVTGRHTACHNKPAMTSSSSHWVLREQVRLLYDNSLSANAALLVISLILVLALHISIDPWPRWTWFGLVAASVCVRLLLLRDYRRDPERLSDKTWARRYILVNLPVGTIWGAMSLFHYLAADNFSRNLVVVVIMGTMAASIPVLSVILPAFLAYLLPQATWISVVLFLEAEAISFYLAQGIIVYSVLIVAAGTKYGHQIRQSLELQFQNQQLIAQLNEEIEQRREAHRLVERHGEELEQLVKRRTQQLLKTNRDLKNEITERRQAEENLRHLAHHDGLTNLPNRLLLDARLQHAIERARRNENLLASLFLDLDHFKNINDSLGHATGDEMLRIVASRLRGSVREDDTVARLGGDEFVVIMEQVQRIEDVTLMARKLMEILREPIDIHGHELSVGVSVGISLFPQDGDSAEVLLKNADAAMYRAKESGRNSYAFYTRELTSSAYDRMMLEGQLRRALERGELLLHYQPQVNLDSGDICALEALVRWQSSDNELLPPSRFLPIAEESGLILPIGRWVLETACRQMATWKSRGVGLQRMAVNLSGKQIQQHDLAETVRDVLTESGCRAEWLELEITEGFIMGEAKQSIRTLDALRKLGVHLAIDDFGTGYSSLSYLKRLPVDKLKIDRSFIRDLAEDPNDAAIVSAIIAMGKGLQLEITAEGVETEVQAAFLKQRGCQQAQGFYYGKPAPAESTVDLLSNPSTLTG